MASLSGPYPCCVGLSAWSALLRRTHYGAQSHTPRNRCVRFVAGVAVGARNTQLPGCLLSITWVGLSPTDRASFVWRLRRGGPIPEVSELFIFLPRRSV